MPPDPGRELSFCGLTVPAASPAPPNVEVSLSVSNAEVAPGDDLDIELRARNTGEAPAEWATGWRNFEVWLADEGGKILWFSWSGEWGDELHGSPGLLQPVSVAPGSAETERVTWRQVGCRSAPLKLSPGSYTVGGAWLTQVDGPPIEHRAYWAEPIALTVTE